MYCGAGAFICSTSALLGVDQFHTRLQSSAGATRRSHTLQREHGLMPLNSTGFLPCPTIWNDCVHNEAPTSHDPLAARSLCDTACVIRNRGQALVTCVACSASFDFSSSCGGESRAGSHLPAVLRPRLPAGDHDVGTEAVQWDVLRHLLVQVGDRFLREKQKLSTAAGGFSPSTSAFR